MKKMYLFKFVFLFITVILSSQLHAIEVQRSSINAEGYVILLGTYVGIKDAERFANQFKHEKIYILKDETVFTVRIVNIKNRELALEKLAYIKRIVPDAMIWKKMDFLKEERYNKLYSQIYTID